MVKAVKKKTGGVIRSNFRNSYYESEQELRSKTYNNGGTPDYRNDFYNQGDPRRALERADYKIVGSGAGSMASCPSEPIIGTWPGRPWMTDCEE